MAQLGRPAILSKINTFITENTTGAITATQLNGILKDIADSCFNLDTDESLAPSLIDVLAQGNSTQGNSINLNTGDFIYNEDIPFVLGYNQDDTKNRMAVVGFNPDMVMGLMLQEDLGENISRFFYEDFITERFNSFNANKFGLELISEDPDFASTVNITPKFITNDVNDINGNSVFTQNRAGFLYYVTESGVDHSSTLTMGTGSVVIQNKFDDGSQLYTATLNVDAINGVILNSGDGLGNSSNVNVHPDRLRASKGTHTISIDPNHEENGTGFYTSNEDGSRNSQIYIDHEKISHRVNNVYESVLAEFKSDQTRISVSDQDNTSSLFQNPFTASISSFSSDADTLARITTYGDQFQLTFEGVDFYHLFRGNAGGFESSVANDLLGETRQLIVPGTIYTSTESGNKIATLIQREDFYEFHVNGEIILAIDENGVHVPKHLYPQKDLVFGHGSRLTYPDSEVIINYQTNDYFPNGQLQIGAYDSETSMGAGIIINETSFWTNLESSYQADQYFLEDVYLQNSRVYADNAAAVTAGLPLNAVYVTPTGEVRVRV